MEHRAFAVAHIGAEQNVVIRSCALHARRHSLRRNKRMLSSLTPVRVISVRLYLRLHSMHMQFPIVCSVLLIEPLHEVADGGRIVWTCGTCKLDEKYHTQPVAVLACQHAICHAPLLILR